VALAPSLLLCWKSQRKAAPIRRLNLGLIAGTVRSQVGTAATVKNVPVTRHQLHLDRSICGSRGVAKQNHLHQDSGKNDGHDMDSMGLYWKRGWNCLRRRLSSSVLINRQKEAMNDLTDDDAERNRGLPPFPFRTTCSVVSYFVQRFRFIFPPA
jgi:hypothetical protein